MTDPVLGGNLLAYSLQVALVAVAGGLAMWLVRIDVPSARYTYWRTLLVLCLVLPLIQPWTPRLPEPVEVPLATDSATPPGSRASNVSPGEQTVNVAAATTSPYVSPLAIVLLLAAGTAARLAWLTAGLRRLRRLRRTGTRAAGADINELCCLIDVGAEVRFVPGRGQPATFGFRRPVVLLPDSLRSLDPAIQRAIAAHELWHVRRRDWIWVVAEEIVCAAFWFHPAIWWLVRRVRDAREEAVDELTILVTGARRPYLEALLAFADEPPMFAAAAFARRRHLFHRMVLISKEAVMSSQRLVTSCAAMAAIVLGSGWYAVRAFPLAAPAAAQQPSAPPRDPAQIPSAAQAEENLEKAIAANPRDVHSHLALAKLQEGRGDLAAAASTLMALRARVPNDKTALAEIARFYVRAGDFDRAVATLEDIVRLDPSDPERHHVITVFYWEKAFRDQTLSPAQKAQYIQAGIASADRALALNPDYTDALVYKNILLRMQAQTAPDPITKQRLIEEADALRARALALNAKRQTERRPMPGAGTMAPPPPPPPPPPPDGFSLREVDGTMPVRVGGDVKTPRKIAHVDPVYPDDARAQRIQGVVIMEVTLDTAGRVANTRVLRSIPMLDHAAVDAVRQWLFEPSYVDGQPVPVAMTITVNFSLQ